MERLGVVIGVNLWGVIHRVRVFTPLMLAQNAECHIINTSSAAGLIVGGGFAPYAVSKHAVVGLLEGLLPSWPCSGSKGSRIRGSHARKTASLLIATALWSCGAIN